MLGTLAKRKLAWVNAKLWLSQTDFYLQMKGKCSLSPEEGQEVWRCRAKLPDLLNIRARE